MTAGILRRVDAVTVPVPTLEAGLRPDRHPFGNPLVLLDLSRGRYPGT